jgi:hypothetical protein
MPCAFSKARSIRPFIGLGGEDGSRRNGGRQKNKRRAKYYDLTKTGRLSLAPEQDAWQKLTAAVAQILRAV